MTRMESSFGSVKTKMEPDAQPNNCAPWLPVKIKQEPVNFYSRSNIDIHIKADQANNYTEWSPVKIKQEPVDFCDQSNEDIHIEAESIITFDENMNHCIKSEASDGIDHNSGNVQRNADEYKIKDEDPVIFTEAYCESKLCEGSFCHDEVNDLTVSTSSSKKFENGPKRANTRKLKLIVDEVKDICEKKMMSQLSDALDIVNTINVVTPTKNVKHREKKKVAEKLFALPEHDLNPKPISKLFQRHLTTKNIENQEILLNENGNDNEGESIPNEEQTIVSEAEEQRNYEGQEQKPTDGLIFWNDSLNVQDGPEPSINLDKGDLSVFPNMGTSRHLEPGASKAVNWLAYEVKAEKGDPESFDCGANIELFSESGSEYEPDQSSTESTESECEPDHSSVECNESEGERLKLLAMKKKKNNKVISVPKSSHSPHHIGSLPNLNLNNAPEDRKDNLKVQCEVCTQMFSNNYSLLRHMITHKKSKDFTCHVCERKFDRKDTLNRHMITHTNCKPFKCNTCGKAFTQGGSLSKHVLTHSGLKPHVCETCGKRFAQKYVLKKHIRRHTGEKPFQCKICKKFFRHKFSLSEHMKLHARCMSHL